MKVPACVTHAGSKAWGGRSRASKLQESRLHSAASSRLQTTPMLAESETPDSGGADGSDPGLHHDVARSQAALPKKTCGAAAAGGAAGSAFTRAAHLSAFTKVTRQPDKESLQIAFERVTANLEIGFYVIDLTQSHAAFSKLADLSCLEILIEGSAASSNAVFETVTCFKFSKQTHLKIL
jgi:hypothetical protein